MKQSLKKYKGSGYGPINRLLRDNNIPIGEKLNKLINNGKNSIEYETLKDIKNIDSALKINQKFEGKILYRGMKGLKTDVGSLIINKGYSSTTLQKESTLPYLDEHQCCIVYFILPKGFKTYKYKDNTKDKSIIEDELLLERNTQIKIIKQINNEYFGVLQKFKLPKITPKIKNMIKIIQKTNDNLETKIDHFINNKQNDLNTDFEDIFDNFELDYDFNSSDEEVKKLLKKKLKKLKKIK